MATSMLNHLSEKIVPDWTALIVIDMQNDFISPGGVWHQCGEDISMAQKALPRIVALIARARRLLVPIFFIRSIYNSADNRHLSDVFLHQSGKHPSRRFVDVPACVEGSWGWELATGLVARPEDTIVAKHRYSAFSGTDLDSRLRARGVRTLLLTGVTTGVCVDGTARYGFELDYYNVIVADCCGAYTQDSHEQGLKQMHARYGEVTSSDALYAAWMRQGPEQAAAKTAGNQ
ncbi:MAG: cysteine hydrolase [Betaproteobacteria bacterium]|nr:cysteine hydrolase [Betaproteobacteria bacterium]